MLDPKLSARRRDLIRLLEQRPLSSVVVSRYTPDRGCVLISRDMVGWVYETSHDADTVLAEAIFSSEARARLIEKYAQARAEADFEPIAKAIALADVVWEAA